MNTIQLTAIDNLELTLHERELLIAIVHNSRHDRNVMFPDWNTLPEITGFTRRQTNRILMGLIYDGTIMTVNCYLFPPVGTNAGILIEGVTIDRPEPPMQKKPIMPKIESGFVYLIHGIDTPWYKIGKTKDIKGRIKAFRTEGPFKHETICVAHVKDMALIEEVAHQRFENKRVEGEWFVLDDKDIEECISLFNEYGN